MTVAQYKDELGLEVLAGDDLSAEVTGCYISDLLSLAMSRVQAGDAWVTVQTNVNILAVASLTEAACVIVAEGTEVDDAVVAKAAAQDVVLLRSDKTAYQLARAIG